MWEQLAIQGALAGGSALASGLASSTSRSGAFKQRPIMSQDQIGRAEWAGNRGMQQIQDPYAGFEPIAQRAQSMYRQNTLPGLAERFTSMGSGSALSSPAFQSQRYGSAQNLSESLAAMMSQYGLQQQGLGQGLFGYGQKPQFDTDYMSGGPTWLSSLFGGLSSGMGAAAKGYGSASENDKLDALTKQLKAINAGGK